MSIKTWSACWWLMAIVLLLLTPAGLLAQEGGSSSGHTEVKLPIIRTGGDIPVESASVTEALDLGGNLIRNGDFNWGIQEWNYYSDGSSRLTWNPVVVYLAWARVDVYTATSNMQMFQTNIPLKPNTNYVLMFRAASTGGHDMGVYIHKHGSPYTNYGLSENRVDLGPYDGSTYPEDWAFFTLPFVSSGFDAPVTDARLRFWFVGYAQPGDQYAIDDVALYEVGGANMPPVARDDNYRIGQGTTLIVPAPGVLGNDSDPEGHWITASGVVDAPSHGRASLTSNGSVWYEPDAGFVGVDQFTYYVNDGELNSNPATVYVEVGAVSNENLIRNGTFESGTSDWNFYANVAARFWPICQEGGCRGRVELYSRGTNIQLYQTNLVLKPHTRYRLSFDAYATNRRDYQVFIHKHGYPYTNYGLAHTVSLNAGAWTPVVVEFESANFTTMVTDGRLRLWFAPTGQAGDIFEVDNIQLQEIGGP